MEDAPGQSEINEEIPEKSGVLKSIYAILQEHGISPVRILWGLKKFEIADVDIGAQIEEEFSDLASKSKLPHVIVEAAHPDAEVQSVIAKFKVVKDDSKFSGNCEYAYYLDLLPELQAALTEDVKSKIKVPQLLASGEFKPKYPDPNADEYHYVLTEYAEGQQLGHLFYETDFPMEEEEYEKLFQFMHTFHRTLAPERVRELSPNIDLNDKGATSTVESHQNRLTELGQVIINRLGPEYLERMQQLLQEKTQFLESHPEICTNHDINPSNLIRSEKGEIYVIDWERVKTTKNEAAVYTYLYASHWRYPEVQAQMLEILEEQNKDVSDFDELFRLDLIFYRYLRLLNNYDRRAKNASPEKMESLEGDVKVISELLKDAIDSTGIWAKKE